jgi:oleate hydratase
MEKDIETRDKHRPKQTEAWILGSGTASLASAFYLIKYAKITPHKVHIL